MTNKNPNPFQEKFQQALKITGHKSERSFLQYIRISQEENADKLLKHPFFK